MFQVKKIIELKLLILILTINSVIFFAESKPSKCYNYRYKPYKNRSLLLSYLDDSHPIGHLSLTGTHDTMVYETTDLNIKTQEVSISFQLRSGVRVMDISLNMRSNVASTFSLPLNEDADFSIARSNRSLGYLFKKLHKFLKEFPREFIVVYLSDLEDGFDDNKIVKLDLCETLYKYKTEENGGGRWVGNWAFNDTLGMHRGKILFATNLYSFDKCARVLKDECQFLQKRPLEEPQEEFVPSHTNLLIDYLWYKHVIMLSMNKYNGASCYVNDFHLPSTIFPRGIAKYGGILSGQCFQPINYRLGQLFPGTQPKAMNFLIVDYFTENIIARNHFINEVYRLL